MCQSEPFPQDWMITNKPLRRDGSLNDPQHDKAVKHMLRTRKKKELSAEQVQPLVNALQFAVDWLRGTAWQKDPMGVLDDALAHAHNLGLHSNK